MEFISRATRKSIYERIHIIKTNCYIDSQFTSMFVLIMLVRTKIQNFLHLPQTQSVSGSLANYCLKATLLNN